MSAQYKNLHTAKQDHLSKSVVLNLFYAISHFAASNLNIPPPPCNELWHFVINTIASAITPRNTVGALRLAYWALCIVQHNKHSVLDFQYEG